MPDTTGTINAKKLGSTGFTEDMVDKLYSQVGRHHMAIVDLQVVNHSGPDVEGKRTVTLIIDAIEPAVTDDLAEHLRELMRTVYFSRGVGDQLTLTDGADEPTVEAVLAAGAKHRPHPFLPVDASDDNPICDVYGTLETAGVHSVQETLDDETSDDDEPVTDKQLDAVTDDPGEFNGLEDANEPWEYDGPEGATAAADTIPDPFAAPQPATT